METATAPLPRLRAELRVVATTVGGPCTLYDPLRSRFFRLDGGAAAMLQVWPHCTLAEQVASRCDALNGSAMTVQNVNAFTRWLGDNELTETNDEAGWRARAAVIENQRHGWFMWLVHNYLFVKIPLFAPQRFLQILSPWLAPLFSKWFVILTASCGVLGLHLASREWERLLATLPDLFSLQASILFVAAIAVVKSLHELGHAAMATRYGCKVPSMGICFMVLVPMLYTDVSDAWKLSSRKQRIMIDAAGMSVELCVACFSLLAWVLLPEGAMKSLAAMLATTSLLLSLGLNLNPLMRFDGYYILSDLIGVENLQERAFALGRWKMREWLFAPDAPAPERLSRRLTTGLIGYAWAVWVYRLILFTGIAVFVYQASFKLLGIVLFAVEIVYFIALPIWRETRVWWSMRADIAKTRRSLVTALVCGGAIAALFAPWSTHIAIPAVIEDVGLAQLYPQRVAYVVEAGAQRGAHVQSGTLIAGLASPDLDHEIALTKLKMMQAQRRLERRTGDAEDRAQTHVLERALHGFESRLVGLEAERRELRVVSPINGILAEVDPHLFEGRWLQRNDLIALVRATKARIVRGYVSEDDVARLDLTATATFVPEQLDHPRVPAAIAHVAPVGVGALDMVELASHYGGTVATRTPQRASGNQQLMPVTGQFLVTARVLNEADGNAARVERGVLHAQGQPESIAARTWRHVLKVLVRESGF